MKEQKTDINEEYERLFGAAQKVDLFEPEEDYYGGLRQEIINAPRERVTVNGRLFSGVELLPYPRFAVENLMSDIENRGHTPFYIRQSMNLLDDYCFAVGYYIPTINMFVVIRYSYIRNRSIEFDDVDKSYLENDGTHWYLNRKRFFPSAKAAASFVLGRNAHGDEWKDKTGKSLFEHYPDMAREASQEKDLFYISEGCVEATGYFDSNAGFFYIQEGSHVAASIQRGFSSNSFYSPRLRFLREACEFVGSYYRVKRDAKCRSALAAACYVLGRQASYRDWKDEYGACLDDYFPYKPKWFNGY